MKRVWFNHWFSTAYNVITMIREENPDYYIIGSNERERNVLTAVCDEMYQEPVLPDEEYADYCLQFCQEHQVDLFLPRRGILPISQRKADFEAIGVKVMVDDYPMVNILNHKDMAYDWLREKGVSTIPDYRIVTRLPEFLEAYNFLKDKYGEVCIKFVHDEGGKSFRHIDNNRKGYGALFKKQNTRMTLDDIVDALSERKVFAHLLVMPYLSGEEVSVDCLQTAKGPIMVPRIKGATRVEQLTFRDEVLEKTHEIFDLVKLEWPCNVQFKYLDGKPWFLEINTRMSGGVQMACAAAKVNIPSIAIHKLLGINDDWSIDTTERMVTHVETPVVF